MFGMDTTKEEDVQITRLSGVVDAYTAPQFKAKIHGFLIDGEKNNILSMDEVEYFDSTALGVCIGLLKRSRELGGLFVIAITLNNFRVREVFRITGLDKVFDIYETEREALDFIRNPARTEAKVGA